jgi:hypothetical protein
MSKASMWRAGTTAAVCAVLGAGVGITASAASPRRSTVSVHGSRVAAKTGAAGSWGGWFGAEVPVQGDVVVLDKAGNGYITETIDDGAVTGVSGDHLTIREGTSSMPYKTIQMTIPASAAVQRDGNSTALSDLKAGDLVVVRHSSDGTAVLAAGTGMTGRSNGPWGDGWEGYGRPSGAWGGYGRTGSWTTRGVGAPAGW